MQRFALQTNKGAFALLLGSGLSRSAEIPTGWDIVVDLVTQVAQLSGETPADPIEWYRHEFSEEPDYSELLAQLSVESSVARVNILERYIKPSEDDLKARPRDECLLVRIEPLPIS